MRRRTRLEKERRVRVLCEERRPQCAASLSKHPRSRPCGLVAGTLDRSPGSVDVGALDTGIRGVCALAQRVGRYVADAPVEEGHDQPHSATLEVRIPAARFDDALAGLRPLGTLESVNVSTADVRAGAAGRDPLSWRGWSRAGWASSGWARIGCRRRHRPGPEDGLTPALSRFAYCGFCGFAAAGHRPPRLVPKLPNGSTRRGCSLDPHRPPRSHSGARRCRARCRASGGADSTAH